MMKFVRGDIKKRRLSCPIFTLAAGVAGEMVEVRHHK